MCKDKRMYVRTDKATGERTRWELSEVLKRLEGSYLDASQLTQLLAAGQPVPTAFAVYQHVRFVDNPGDDIAADIERSGALSDQTI